MEENHTVQPTSPPQKKAQRKAKGVNIHVPLNKNKNIEQFRLVLLLGLQVARAFNFPKPHLFQQCLVPTSSHQVLMMVIPHPSGVSRYWNSQENKQKAQKQITDVLQSSKVAGTSPYFADTTVPVNSPETITKREPETIIKTEPETEATETTEATEATAQTTETAETMPLEATAETTETAETIPLEATTTTETAETETTETETTEHESRKVATPTPTKRKLNQPPLSQTICSPYFTQPKGSQVLSDEDEEDCPDVIGNQQDACCKETKKSCGHHSGAPQQENSEFEFEQACSCHNRVFHRWYLPSPEKNSCDDLE